jgi:hypothetical protein
MSVLLLLLLLLLAEEDEPLRAWMSLSAPQLHFRNSDSDTDVQDSRSKEASDCACLRFELCPALLQEIMDALHLLAIFLGCSSFRAASLWPQLTHCHGQRLTA